MVSKEIKINITKHVEEPLCPKNYKNANERIKKLNLNKWKDIWYLWIEGLNIVKIT